MALWHDMKGCFVLQRRFARIGHQIATLLTREYGLTEACAYIQVRDNLDFLKSQTDVPYTALLLDEDVHREYVNETLDLEYLKKLENDIGDPVLWSFIGADRVVRYGQLVREYPYDTPLYSHEDMLRLTQVYGKRITAFLDAEKPDFAFMLPAAGLGTLILQALLRKRGIPTYLVMISGVDGATGISTRLERLTGVDDIVRTGSIPSEYREKARRFIKSFRTAPRSYSRLYDARHWQQTRARQLAFLSPRGLRAAVHMVRRNFTEWFIHPELRHDYTTVRPWHYYGDRIRRKMQNILGYSQFYDSYEPGHAFFPLHLEPELTLLVQAQFALNQREIIRQIAQSLPVGMRLYVKEHPQMVGFRPRWFYRELKKIPNVKLINPSMPGTSVIRDAAIVFTIAGGSGFEAILLQKPVITFGDVYYNALSPVAHSRVSDELPRVVQTQLARTAFDEEELERYVAAIYMDCVPVDFAYLWVFDNDPAVIREKLQEYTALLAHKVGLARHD